MIINKDLKYILIESIYFRTLENLKLNFILVKITSGFHVKKIKSFRSNSGLLKMNWIKGFSFKHALFKYENKVKMLAITKCPPDIFFILTSMKSSPNFLSP